MSMTTYNQNGFDQTQMDLKGIVLRKIIKEDRPVNLNELPDCGHL